MSRPFIMKSRIEAPPQPTCVYAIGCGDYVKIGVAVNVELRMRALQIANPTPLTLLDSREFLTKERARLIERCIHGELVDQHASGEWFRRQPIDPLVWLDFYHDQDLKLRNAAA